MSYIHYDYINKGLSNRVLGRKRKSEGIISGVVLISLLIIILGWVITKGLDSGIQNRDTMLCESALVSKNVEYLEKCECYYKTNNIRCLQEGR